MASSLLSLYSLLMHLKQNIDKKELQCKYLPRIDVVYVLKNCRHTMIINRK